MPPDRAESWGEGTRAVHLPDVAPFAQRPMALPVHRSTTFRFRTAQEYADVLGGREPGYTYSRIANPTVDAFAAAVAALEGEGVGGPVAGDAFGSGMAAISTTLLTLTGAGRHVVASAALYGGTYAVLTRLLRRFGVECSLVERADPAGVAAAIRPETALVYAETLANPTTAVADLPGLAQAAHVAGVPLVVDSTFAGPAVCRPLTHGADLVIHSATKYLGGHSDATGGVVVGRPDLVAAVRDTRSDLGGALGPDDAFLLNRGLATLPLRTARHCATALVYARALAGHPAVLRVEYPGLPDHPGHDLAGRLFVRGPGGNRYGAIVAVTPRGGREAGMAFCDGLRLAAVATSLGGTHTLVSHVASTTHRQLDDAALRGAGIDPGTVRVSIGLEDADDLVADALASLERLP